MHLIIKKILKIIKYNILIFISGIFLIELIFGNWFNKNSFSNLIVPRNITKVWNPTHYKSDSPAKYTRDKYGLRNYHSIDKINILAIGGSTTDERWIDDNLTWVALLEKKFKANNFNLNIVNAGVDGQSTLGHINNFTNWFNKIKNFNPEYYLLYIGINDALVFVKSTLNNNQIYNFRADYLIEENKLDNFIRYIKNNSIFYKIIKIYRGHAEAKKYNLTHKTQTWNNYKTTGPIKFSKKKVNKQLIEYELRLNNLINTIYKKKSIPIIVTQTIHPNHKLSEALKLINQVSKKYCLEKKIKCILLDENIKFNFKEDFYDGVHTRPSGNYKIANYLFEQLSLYFEN